MGRLQFVIAGFGFTSLALAGCGGGGNTNMDMGTGGGGDMACASYEKGPNIPTPPALYYQPDEPMGTKAASDYSCLGSFKDPEITVQDTENVKVTDAGSGKLKIWLKGRIRDFQDDQPVAGADLRIYLSADDVLMNKPIASLKQYQKDVLKQDPPRGTAGANDPDMLQIGEYTIEFELPSKTQTRIIIGNVDGRAIDSGNKLETIPTYEFFRRWNERNPVAIKLATKQAIPGLVSVTQRDGLGVLAGSIRDCKDNEVGGAIVQVTAGNYIPDPEFPSCADNKPYDGQKQNLIFYFTDVGGSTLPTRVQKWTSGNAAVAALNVPPGKGKITVSGVVETGAVKELNSAEVPVLADSVTIVDLPPK